MRIAIIAAARFPVVEPFAGGLEAHVWGLADRLRTRGHEVTLFAGPGSDPAPRRRTARSPAAAPERRRASGRQHDGARVGGRAPRLPAADAPSRSLGGGGLRRHPQPQPALPPRGDGRDGAGADRLHAAHAADAVAGIGESRPTSTARRISSPSASTPRGPGRTCSRTRASSTTASTLAAGRQGPGGGPPVWFGRIAPEKGTHLAIDAAVLAGTAACDWRARSPTEPTSRLRSVRGWRWRASSTSGHLTHAELVRFLGAASVALVTPCWDEPYGLVVAEALACGTPVCAFARGGLPELLPEDCGRLVAPGRCRSARGGARPGQPALASGGPPARDQRVLDRRDGRRIRRALRDARGGPGHVIGYYVHHQGDGPRHPCRRDRRPPRRRTGHGAQLASAPRRLARALASARPRRRSAPTARIPTAGGALHWAPSGHPGLRGADGPDRRVGGDARPAAGGGRRVGRGHRPAADDGCSDRRDGHAGSATRSLRTSSPTGSPTRSSPRGPPGRASSAAARRGRRRRTRSARSPASTVVRRRASGAPVDARGSSCFPAAAGRS